MSQPNVHQFPDCRVRNPGRAAGGTIAAMPNIASILKSEISRVARKELRAEVAGVKKATSSHRSDIAAIKRRLLAIEQQLRQLGKTSARPAPAAPEDSGAADARRFSAKGFASQRRRLGLSAPDFGLLLGVSAQSIYNWEEGKVRPRGAHLPAIAALRSLGKKQATAHLASLKTQS
jgi:DNA-binding transcriptional regulator YiaG